MKSILYLILPILLITSSFSFSNEEEKINLNVEVNQIQEQDDNLVLVSPDEVVVLPEGIFIVDETGTLAEASVIYSTTAGLYAKKQHDNSPYCRECGRELSKRVCFNPGCKRYRTHQ